MPKLEEALLLAATMRPYYARAISALTPVESESCATIGVDTSWRLYWHPAFVEATPLRQLAAVIAAHEVEHLLRDHASRRCERSHRAWNIAGDLEINDDSELELPKDGSYPSTYGLPDHLLAEEYFEQLASSSGPAPCCGSGAGSPLPGELAPTGLALDAAANAALVAAVRQDVREQASRSPGTVPAGVVMWAESKPEPVRLPWPRLLAAAIRGERGGYGRSDYSWSRLSRRQSGVIRPTLVAIRPRVALIVDTSGSMRDDGAKVLGVVREIVSRSHCSLVATVECDAVARMKRRANGWTGGGGTDLRDGFARIAKLRRDMTLVVTDCESPWPEIAVPNTVVIATSTSLGPSWAKTIAI